MIQLRNIEKSFNGRKILKSISLDFNSKTLNVIKGVSGCGKTTLLNIIGCIDLEYNGEYYFDGNLLKNKKDIEKIREQIGYVYQESLLFSHLNVMDNLLFFSNEKEKIMELAEKLQVHHLMNKYPSQLSNGERQRISIIRSMLGNKKIIIADEPTASLDHAMALEIVQIFHSLKEQGYIIIISTHDHIFDEYADDLIHLDYGVISNEKELNEIRTISEEKIYINKNRFFKENIKYSKNRFKKMGIWSTVFLSLLLYIIFCSSGIRLHAQKSYESYVKEKYPTHVFSMFVDKPYVFEYDTYKVYEDYTFYEENGDAFAPLLTKYDSSLNIPNAIVKGKFPEKENEVIINDVYRKTYFKGITQEQCIGKTIRNETLNMDLIVSGILNSDEEITQTVYNGCSFYGKLDQYTPIVFVNYQLLENKVSVFDDSHVMISYPSLEKDSLLYEHLSNFDHLPWNYMIYQNMYTINLFLDIIFICLFMILLISFLFIMNMIQYELFNRRKEIGFLKVFGLKNQRIFQIIWLEYVYKIGISLVISIGAYFLTTLAIYHFFHISILLNIKEMLVLLLLIVLYIYGLIKIPFRKMNRKNILYFIKD